MVVKMMKWRPWPPLLSKKLEVKLVVKRLEGCCSAVDGGETDNQPIAVAIRWKGPKIGLSSFRRTVKKNITKEVVVGLNGVVEWEEEFSNLCSLSGYKDNVFHPWEISFTVLNGLNPRLKNKVPTGGTASLNLAEFAAKAEGKVFEMNIPLILSGTGAEPRPSLIISLGVLELRAAQEPAESVQRPIVRSPSPQQSQETSSSEKDEFSALKAGLRKVKIFTEYVSTRKSKKACREEDGSEGRCSARSEDGDYTYPFDSDSLDEFEEGESDEVKEDSTVRNSFSYGTLAYANCAGGSAYSSLRGNCTDEGWVYYSNRKSDVGCSNIEDSTAPLPETVLQNSKRSILPWRKRKLSFRSPKAKGEPLLKKDYGEEGGDDIDFDRRQLTDDSLSCGSKTDEDSSAHRLSVSEFGEDNFTIGSWEEKEVTSRDGHMKLRTQAFFASIDQRSERAAGESACTALVAVIADWFQNNRNILPIKSQFDALIREGSLEWRNLCENESYRERFPDKHFDLETVLQAKIRSLLVVPEKSFIGFFHPDEMEEGRFDFLHGAMSFDSMWEEISNAGSECSTCSEPQIYIVSWNDHFFVLKVEPEAYYIIDTLGERLYEGCSQAYILKFDRNTTINRLPTDSTQSTEDKAAGDKQIVVAEVDSTNQQVDHKVNSLDEPQESAKSETEEVLLVNQGKESCKEYIKSFLAAIPIRELQADIKKGLTASTLLHQRLQIEIHYTRLQIPSSKSSDIELGMTATATSTPVSEVTCEEVATY